MLLLAACASGAGAEPPDPRQELKNPQRTFPVFQELLGAGLYGEAFDCLSFDAQKAVGSYEAFYFAFTAFEASRRLIGSLRVHGLDETGRLRLCSPEFGMRLDMRLSILRVKKGEFHLLDFTSRDIGYIKDRAFAWHRHQVKRADGWHFAYPPDWTYAPLARSCICEGRHS